MEKNSSSSENKSNLNKLSNIKDSYIDDNGVFKYVQIYVSCKDNSKVNKIVVRGYNGLEYHKQMFNKFEKDEKDSLMNCRAKCIGGGRIEISSKEKFIYVYGYSKRYGKCDHELSIKLIKTQYPDYKYSWSNEGY